MQPHCKETKGQRDAQKRGWQGKRQKNNTADSNVVPHRSTNAARSCLTSLSRREAVLSWLYGRSCLHATSSPYTYTPAILPLLLLKYALSLVSFSTYAKSAYVHRYKSHLGSRVALPSTCSWWSSYPWVLAAHCVCSRPRRQSTQVLAFYGCHIFLCQQGTLLRSKLDDCFDLDLDLDFDFDPLVVDSHHLEWHLVLQLDKWTDWFSWWEAPVADPFHKCLLRKGKCAKAITTLIIHDPFPCKLRYPLPKEQRRKQW